MATTKKKAANGKKKTPQAARNYSHHAIAKNKGPQHNPHKARPKKTNYRRNPRVWDTLKDGAIAGVGAIGTDIIQQMIPTSWIPGGPWGKILIRTGVSLGVAAIGERFVAAQTAHLLAIGGLVGASQDAGRMLMGTLGGYLAPKQPVILPPAQIAPGVTPAAMMAAASVPGDSVNDISYRLNDITSVPGWMAMNQWAA